MKAVYIGAGIDLRPLTVLTNIKEFYYLDGQPNSEFGTLKSIRPNGTNGFSRPNFIPMLDEEMKKNKMNLINIDNNLRVYSNGKQKVKYYTNTAIPGHYDIIKEDIKNFTTLIVAGHDPDSIILESSHNKINFVGFENTSYYNESNSYIENYNSVIHRLHNGNIENKFNQFSYYKQGKMLYFNSWKDFYEEYMNSSWQKSYDKYINIDH